MKFWCSKRTNKLTISESYCAIQSVVATLESSGAACLLSAGTCLTAFKQAQRTCACSEYTPPNAWSSSRRHHHHKDRHTRPIKKNPTADSYWNSSKNLQEQASRHTGRISALQQGNFFKKKPIKNSNEQTSAKSPASSPLQSSFNRGTTLA